VVTVVVECAQRKGKIVPLDQAKLERWKKRHREGEVYDMILSDYTSSALSPMAKKFHAIRDEYADMLGYDNEHAKIELKALHGVTAPADAPPEGRTGRVVEYHGRKIWLLSIRDYTLEELGRLVDGSELTYNEAGA